MHRSELISSTRLHSDIECGLTTACFGYSERTNARSLDIHLRTSAGISYGNRTFSEARRTEWARDENRRKRGKKRGAQHRGHVTYSVHIEVRAAREQRPSKFAIAERKRERERGRVRGLIRTSISSLKSLYLRTPPPRRARTDSTPAGRRT